MDEKREKHLLATLRTIDTTEELDGFIGGLREYGGLSGQVPLAIIRHRQSLEETAERMEKLRQDQARKNHK